MQMQQAQAAEAGGQQLLSNGIALMGNSINTFAQAGSSKGTDTSTPNSSPTPTPTADTKVADANNSAQAGAGGSTPDIGISQETLDRLNAFKSQFLPNK